MPLRRVRLGSLLTEQLWRVPTRSPIARARGHRLAIDPSQTLQYLPLSAFNRFAVTRELNDGLLAPRFAPSERGYVLSGFLTRLTQPVGASVPEDADLR